MGLVVAVMLVSGCQQGTAVESGAPGVQGPSGPVGATGPQGPAAEPGAKGETGGVGPAGLNGADGRVIVLALADGGALTVDGGLVIVSGPVGGQGPVGAEGAQGAAGTPGAAGAVGAPGATGPVGPAGAPGLRVLALDGGVLGFFTGADFWSATARCFTGLDTLTPSTVGSIRTNVCYANPDCTGAAYLVEAQTAGTPIGFTPVGRCLTGSGRAVVGGPMTQLQFRMAPPYASRSGLTLYGCSTFPGIPSTTCSLQSPPIEGGYPLELTGGGLVQPFPRGLGDFVVQEP